MAKSHERPESPTPDALPSKKMKTTHLPLSDGVDITAAFTNGVLDHTNIAKLNKTYVENKPFHYALVEKLFQDDLLKNVKDECLTELSFTEKQTDIYKVNQTGDLASLNYLSASQISLLPSLLKLRDALYSSDFRSFLRNVTGCGPLSGTKQDMSVNSYTKGCHLLNHDDVIGTRRVSYILYMPLPHYQFWQKDWGGALELYPTQPGPSGIPEPECVPSKSIPPSWNQFIFFEVQPGMSFHSVEEVVVGGENEEGRERLSISGWFHAAQAGEEGYEPSEEAELKSSRDQLSESKTDFHSYSISSAPPLPDVELSDEHITFLSEYLNPVYLKPRTMSALGARFLEESSLELHSFLSNDLAQALEPRLRQLDRNDGLGPDRHGKIPPHSAGVNLPESQQPSSSTTETDINTSVNIIPQNLPPLQNGLNSAMNHLYGNTANNTKPAEAPVPSAWTLKGPPHKWRYCTLLPPSPSAPATSVTPLSAHPSPSEILRALQDELFPSEAFRAWLATVSRLLPLRYFVEARRFRPGLDYTLATCEEKEARLDVVLGLTPEALGEDEDMENTGSARRRVQRKEVAGWSAAEWGGWECYMAPHNEEDDPAVYRAGTYKRSDVLNNGAAKPSSSSNGHVNGTNGNHKSDGLSANGTSRELPNDHSSPRSRENVKENIDDDETMEGDDDEEDSTLLTVQPGFNRLLLVLRDEKVMRFVKYVSAAAEGSRWDVCAEYEVGMMAEEDEEAQTSQNED